MVARNTTVFDRQGPTEAEINHSLSGSSASVFWLDDVRDQRVAYPRLPGDQAADLVIVGGGYAGLWTALRALERDPARKVVLIEADEIGAAASGRNGGFCEASLTHGEPNGALRWPNEMEQLTQMGLENLDGIADAVLRYGMDCDFERNGILAVAVEPHQVAWLEGEQPSAHSSGYLDQTAVQLEVKSPAFLAGVWERGACATIHPAKLALELARVITELGATIYEHTSVQRLQNAGATTDIVTSRGTVRAAHVVLATNAYPSLLKRNKLMAIPMYDFVLATESLSETQLESIGWSNRQGLSDMANRFHYFRMTSDNRIVFGGGAAKYYPGGKVKDEYEDNPAAYRSVARDFLTYFPQLKGIRFSHKWGGAIDTDTRFCAFFGTARGGKIAYAAGFSGLGVAAARFAADVMLDLLSGRETERTRLKMVRSRPMPFPPEPATTLAVNVTHGSLVKADTRQGQRGILLKAMSTLGLGFET